MNDKLTDLMQASITDHALRATYWEAESDIFINTPN